MSGEQKSSIISLSLRSRKEGGRSPSFAIPKGRPFLAEVWETEMGEKDTEPGYVLSFPRGEAVQVPTPDPSQSKGAGSARRMKIRRGKEYV